MQAYSELYISSAMEKLGEALDYAVQCCDVTASEFIDYFIVSGIADSFGRGSPKVVAGMSGTELVREVLRKTYGLEGTHVFPAAQIEYTCSEEYWAGWILAYYQWSRGYSFDYIIKKIPIDRILESYHPLHEASEERAAASFDHMMDISNENDLARRRRLLGYTQRLLSEKTGVNLRTLQQYEIGSKDLKKASGITLFMLSRKLGCTMEDLINGSTAVNSNE